MSVPKLSLIWIGSEDGQRRLRLDWSNDRHHLIPIPDGATRAEVAAVLRECADMVESNAGLMNEERSDGDINQ